VEIINFYSLNILVGAILSIALGLYGSHVVARDKTMEVVLLGQTIQVGILFGVIVNSIIFSHHDDHGLHLEIVVSVFFTIFVYGFYEKLTQEKKFIKTPVLVLFYTVLLSLSYLTVAASPLVESHMVKAFLGDIVTASKTELRLILLISVATLIFFRKKSREILLQSFDLSLFGHSSTLKAKDQSLFFNLIVLCLMIYSIHVFGIVFTICMMVLPVSIVQFSNSSVLGLYRFIYIASPLSVLIGFLFNIKLDQFPTSSLITISYVIISGGYLLIKKIS
jgi:ABC-type Mn2+/Zn2+ transport system permease subunit